MAVPRIRLFAGPNGSGKSTLIEWFKAYYPSYIGIYVNADNIQKELEQTRSIDLSRYCLKHRANDLCAALLHHLRSHPLYRSSLLDADTLHCKTTATRLYFRTETINAYIAAMIADFIRYQLLKQHISFTFESVMSSRDKIDFLCRAQQKGYRTYLYFIATRDVEINIARVHNRVAKGGHDVPVDKIQKRYVRSMELLPDAMRCANRTFLFDNSGDIHNWILEYADGKALLQTSEIPAWIAHALKLENI